MEAVVLVSCHQVDEPLHELDREEVTPHVQMHAAIAEAGHVVDADLGDGQRARGFAAALELSQGLEGVEEAGRIRCREAGPLGFDLERVAFRRGFAHRLDRQDQIGLLVR